MLHGVVHGDGVGSQITQLLAQKFYMYCKQEQFLFICDYLWSDKEIAQLLPEITEHKT